MRRVANLFEQILEPENIRLAFYKASRGKKSHESVRLFARDLDQRVKSISDAIRNDSFPLGRFHQFLIRDPKERVITAPCFDERVLHHAIMNLCEPVLDQWLIDDTFACRVGKGRERAVTRASYFAHKHSWYLKLDVRKFFDSVRHETLVTLLEKRFKDRRLLQLLNRIIHAYRENIGLGIPIGSLTSQHFANFYLGWFDRFVKETLRVKGYIRYMDDMILWHNDLHELQSIQRRCIDFASDDLGLEFKPSDVRRTSTGVGFLGCRIWPTHVELNRRSKRRWYCRLRVLERAERLGLISEVELQIRTTALTAFATSGGVKSWRFRQSVLQKNSVDDP
ncbi:MAG: reverse transcriptase/maturase family protein [Pirellulaceae bacterium]|nr:reverse transcriptase/maturase family protein [Pirellulaceae bacterium]